MKEIVNNWTIIENKGNGYYLVTCPKCSQVSKRTKASMRSAESCLTCHKYSKYLKPGDKVNLWTIIGRSKKKKGTWIVECICGTKRVKDGYELKKTNCCGCKSSELTKATCLERYGASSYLGSKKNKDKFRQIFLERYGVENPSQCEEIKKKKRETTFKNYGVECYLGTEEQRERARQTSIEKYGSSYFFQTEQGKLAKQEAIKIKFGVSHPMQVPEIALKNAKSQNTYYEKRHWKTNEALTCIGSYEAKTVDYLNNNKIDYLWQPESFTLSNGKTYRPDLYLIETNIWIEIKGWWRRDSKEKWDEFSNQIKTNSELWDQSKLKKIGII